jgi:hypothetical protein
MDELGTETPRPLGLGYPAAAGRCELESLDYESVVAYRGVYLQRRKEQAMLPGECGLFSEGPPGAILFEQDAAWSSPVSSPGS